MRHQRQVHRPNSKHQMNYIIMFIVILFTVFVGSNRRVVEGTSNNHGNGIPHDNFTRNVRSWREKSNPMIRNNGQRHREYPRLGLFRKKQYPSSSWMDTEKSSLIERHYRERRLQNPTSTTTNNRRPQQQQQPQQPRRPQGRDSTKSPLDTPIHISIRKPAAPAPPTVKTTTTTTSTNTGTSTTTDTSSTGKSATSSSSEGETTSALAVSPDSQSVPTMTNNIEARPSQPALSPVKQVDEQTESPSETANLGYVGGTPVQLDSSSPSIVPGTDVQSDSTTVDNNLPETPGSSLTNSSLQEPAVPGDVIPIPLDTFTVAGTIVTSMEMNSTTVVKDSPDLLRIALQEYTSSALQLDLQADCSIIYVQLKLVNDSQKTNTNDFRQERSLQDVVSISYTYSGDVMVEAVDIPSNLTKQIVQEEQYRVLSNRSAIMEYLHSNPLLDGVNLFNIKFQTLQPPRVPPPQASPSPGPPGSPSASVVDPLPVLAPFPFAEPTPTVTSSVDGNGPGPDSTTPTATSNAMVSSSRGWLTGIAVGSAMALMVVGLLVARRKRYPNRSGGGYQSANNESDVMADPYGKNANENDDDEGYGNDDDNETEDQSSLKGKTIGGQDSDLQLVQSLSSLMYNPYGCSQDDIEMCLATGGNNDVTDAAPSTNDKVVNNLRKYDVTDAVGPSSSLSPSISALYSKPLVDDSDVMSYHFDETTDDDDGDDSTPGIVHNMYIFSPTGYNTTVDEYSTEDDSRHSQTSRRALLTPNMRSEEWDDDSTNRPNLPLRSGSSSHHRTLAASVLSTTPQSDSSHRRRRGQDPPAQLSSEKILTNVSSSISANDVITVPTPTIERRLIVNDSSNKSEYNDSGDVGVAMEVTTNGTESSKPLPIPSSSTHDLRIVGLANATITRKPSEGDDGTILKNQRMSSKLPLPSSSAHARHAVTTGAILETIESLYRFKGDNDDTMVLPKPASSDVGSDRGMNSNASSDDENSIDALYSTTINAGARKLIEHQQQQRQTHRSTPRGYNSDNESQFTFDDLGQHSNHSLFASSSTINVSNVTVNNNNANENNALGTHGTSANNTSLRSISSHSPTSSKMILGATSINNREPLSRKTGAVGSQGSIASQKTTGGDSVLDPALLYESSSRDESTTDSDETCNESDVVAEDDDSIQEIIQRVIEDNKMAADDSMLRLSSHHTRKINLNRHVYDSDTDEDEATKKITPRSRVLLTQRRAYIAGPSVVSTVEPQNQSSVISAHNSSSNSGNTVSAYSFHEQDDPIRAAALGSPYNDIDPIVIGLRRADGKDEESPFDEGTESTRAQLSEMITPLPSTDESEASMKENIEQIRFSQDDSPTPSTSTTSEKNDEISNSTAGSDTSDIGHSQRRTSGSHLATLSNANNKPGSDGKVSLLERIAARRRERSLSTSSHDRNSEKATRRESFPGNAATYVRRLTYRRSGSYDLSSPSAEKSSEPTDLPHNDSHLHRERPAQIPPRNPSSNVNSGKAQQHRRQRSLSTSRNRPSLTIDPKSESASPKRQTNHHRSKSFDTRHRNNHASKPKISPLNDTLSKALSALVSPSAPVSKSTGNDEIMIGTI